MRPNMQWSLALGHKIIVCLIVLFACIHCKSTGARSGSLSNADRCNLQPNHAWVGSVCVLTSSVEYKKFQCEAKHDGSTWLKEQCVSVNDQKSLEEACLSKGDGSQWTVDPSTKVGSCNTPAGKLSAEQTCLASEPKAQWQNGLCITAEARKCQAGGDVWTYQSLCVTQEQNACETKGDGSKYLNKRCVSLEEQNCTALGYLFVYKPDAKPVACLPKGYAEYCKDPTTPEDIKATLQIIKTTESLPDDCDAGFQRLQLKNSLTYTNKTISNLAPFANLIDNLTALYLSGNNISDLSPLSSLTKLKTLNLTNNKISNIAPLSKLTSLVGLYLGKNNIKDPSPLKPLAALEVLDLNHNALTDLTAFAYDPTQPTFTKLDDISVNHNCGITSLAPLVGLPALTTVDYDQTSVPPSAIPIKFRDPSTMDEYSLCGEN